MYALTLLLFFQAGGTPKDPKVDTAVKVASEILLKKLQGFYDGMKDYKASFKQDLADPRFGRQQTFYGYVRIKKPGRMRWDFSSPEKKSFIADGKVLWIYEPEDEQVFKRPLGESTLPSTVSFLFGKGSLAKEFEVTAPEDNGGAAGLLPGEIVLRLVPRQANSQYQHLLFVVWPESGEVRRTIVFGRDGKVNSMTFTGAVTNSNQPDTHFKFTPPKGVKVIDAQKGH
jgi:outer membrane lipoprotein carrier protein